jgi:hypothetical protein
MASNVGQFTCMGAVETSPSSIPFWKFINPTDFDFAFENLRKRIKQTSSIWKGFDYLGLFGGDLKSFLTEYIQIAAKNNLVYDPVGMDFWIEKLNLAAPGKFERDDLEKYFETFQQLRLEKQIPDSVWNPSKYVPKKPSVSDIPKAITGIDQKKLLVYGIMAVGAYAFFSGGYKPLLRKS